MRIKDNKVRKWKNIRCKWIRNYSNQWAFQETSIKFSKTQAKDTITFSRFLKIPAEFLPVRWAPRFCCQGWHPQPTTGRSTPSSAGRCWPVSGLAASGWLGPESSDPTDRSERCSPGTVWTKEGTLTIQANRQATEFTVIQSSSQKMKTLLPEEPCTS